jgi:calcineurin-like phosphoesterase family protein
MKRIWLTSDLHLNHSKDFIYKARGFNSIEEMNIAIIENYNSVVSDMDDVFILGDCIMGNINEGIELLDQLKGNKYLAYGNHDTNNKIKAYVDNDIFKNIQMGYRLKYKKMEFLLTHYPTLVANYDDPKPVYNLSGHTHQSDSSFSDIAHNYNVGVDCHQCYPIALDDIYQEIKENRKK